MKRGEKGLMNFDFSETYDREEDTYYVTFKTGEPSYCVEIDDILVLEVGLFSNLPTGFRILNFTKHKVGMVKLHSSITRAMENSLKKSQPTFAERKGKVTRALEKVLA